MEAAIARLEATVEALTKRTEEAMQMATKNGERAAQNRSSLKQLDSGFRTLTSEVLPRERELARAQLESINEKLDALARQQAEQAEAQAQQGKQLVRILLYIAGGGATLAGGAAGVAQLLGG